jgi:predicted ATPase
MRDTIGWSYDLLSDEEKRGFLRFSVFMGGATPEAAAAILNPGSQPAPSVLHLLSGLVEKSMLYVREQTASSPRFQMLEIVREYAIECLEAGEAEDMKRLHVEYFKGLAECARMGRHLPEQIDPIDAIMLFLS